MRALLAGVFVLAAAAAALALLNFPLHRELGGLEGIVFWVAIVILSSATPVRMSSGVMVNVAIAPLVAVAALGGPAAAAIVSIGTLEIRELRGMVPGRGGVPWYGTLYNLSEQLLPAIAAAMVCVLLLGQTIDATPLSLAVVTGAGLVYFAINNLMAALATSVRDGIPILAVLRLNLRQFGMMAGLAPVAGLMAVMYVVMGPIGVLPFAVPLLATREGYQKVVEIRDMFTQTVRSLASAVDAKDPFTAGHSVRVQAIARDLGAELRCDDKELEALEWGGLLHDIGKIGIPDAILLKQGSLTPDERRVMNTHPVKGEEIIRPVARLAPELPVIRHHHEWYDGSGYPDGLKGDQIPWLARIMHVADAYEAMTAARPYQMTPLTANEALAELHRFAGRQFDPQVVSAFDRLVRRRPTWSRPEQPPPAVRPKHIPRLGEQPDAPILSASA
jgi:hypothetical protein